MALVYPPYSHLNPQSSWNCLWGKIHFLRVDIYPISIIITLGLDFQVNQIFSFIEITNIVVVGDDNFTLILEYNSPLPPKKQISFFIYIYILICIF